MLLEAGWVPGDKGLVWLYVQHRGYAEHGTRQIIISSPHPSRGPTTGVHRLCWITQTDAICSFCAFETTMILFRLYTPSMPET